MHVCGVSNKNFVEEVITQIALIGCQNLGAYCVTVAWPSQRRRGGRALSDWGRKLEPTHPWAIFQLNSDFFRNKILLILKAWVLLLILTVLRLIKAPSRLFAEKLKKKNLEEFQYDFKCIFELIFFPLDGDFWKTFFSKCWIWYLQVNFCSRLWEFSYQNLKNNNN